MKLIFKTALVALIYFAVSVCTVQATVISYFTPAGSTTGGQPVDAKATFTTGANSITVVLENLQSDPKSVVQNLSDLLFTVTTGENAGTLSSSSALERTVHGDNTFTDGLVVDTGWSLTPQGAGLFYLNVLGTAIGPAHTLIGPPGGATYANANGSIAGNNAHNPFIALSATFNLTVPGVTAASSISAATFSFGTTEGANLIVGTPEPASWVLAAMGLIGLAGYRRRLVRYHQQS